MVYTPGSSSVLESGSDVSDGETSVTSMTRLTEKIERRFPSNGRWSLGDTFRQIDDTYDLEHFDLYDNPKHTDDLDEEIKVFLCRRSPPPSPEEPKA